MAIEFRLSSILKLRRYERLCRQQEVDSAHRHVVCLLNRSSELNSDRENVRQELRELTTRDSWSAESVSRRHEHSENLARQLSQLKVELAQAQMKWDGCVQKLVAADKQVQALERLEARHRLVSLSRRELIASQEFQDQLGATINSLG